MITSAEGVSDDSPASENSQEQEEVNDLVTLIKNCLDDAKAENVVSIDLQGKTAIGDVMIIASGRSHRHVGAIADQLVKKLKSKGLGKAHVEGLPHCDWVLIDAGDAIVHLFRPEVREFYNLEKIWSADHPAGNE
ncbi:MAG: ribosome silencing factor [Methyloligellaceae bacterium]